MSRLNSARTKATCFSRSAAACSLRANSPDNFQITKPCFRATRTKPVVSNAVEFQDALRRVSQLADQRSHAVKFMLANEGLEISASSPEYGEAKEIIEKEFKGETIAIGFNAQYLLDFLAAAADGPISFELKDEQSAGQLRPTGDETTRYRYVVMPMRI